MSNSLESFDRVARVVYTDPKFKATVEWMRDYGISAQLERQVPRPELEHYVATGQHVNPDRVVSLVNHEMPDFDWWEPRHDQPGRREQTRYREAGL